MKQVYKIVIGKNDIETVSEVTYKCWHSNQKQ